MTAVSRSGKPLGLGVSRSGKPLGLGVSRWLLVLLALFALGVGACSGGDDSSSATTEAPTEDGTSGDEGDDDVPADGCETVTAADAEDLLGEPVEEAEPSPVPGGQVVAECVWGATNERSFGLVQYRLWDGSVYFQPDTFKDGEGFQEVDGVGDGAYFNTMAGTDLTVLVGDRTMTLNVSGAGEGIADDSKADEGAIRQKLEALARRVVDEIG